MAAITTPPGAAPLGSRLWFYTNFDCNLACDYCCSRSSPHAIPQRLPLDVVERACDEFAGLGGRETLLTGGEPFLVPELPRIAALAGRWTPVTILTNAMVFARGSRRRALEALDRSRVTLQVSLDSGTPELHDRHRGAGSFARARAGIELALSLGFRVRVAATIDADDAAEETGLHQLLNTDGIPPDDRLIRRVAHTGFAERGLDLGIDTLWPEPTLAAGGAWWHPVGITEAGMQVASSPLPVVSVLAVIRATLGDASRDRTSALQAFRCT
jgi:hypothetical protein